MRTKFLLMVLLALIALTTASAEVRLHSPRMIVSLNQGWRFHSGDIQGAADLAFDDSTWTSVSIPHVFPYEVSNTRKSVYHGPAWYRRMLESPREWRGKRIFLRFDAASLVSEVFLNGASLGEHRGGFAAFTYEITGKLHEGKMNQLAVLVDNTLNNDVPPLEKSLLYGGIYRPVSLILTDAINITPMDFSSPGVFLKQTTVTPASARVDATTEVSNGSQHSSIIFSKITILDAQGKTILVSRKDSTIPAGATLPIHQSFSLTKPHLWNGVADPYLYSVRIDLLDDTKVIDSITQPLGLRYFHVDPKLGFVLNGVARQIHGVCLHQDWADKGWAIGREEEQQDLNILRAMGVDGLRLVHYQHSQSALDLYDRTGMLIWSELAQFGRVSGTEAYRLNVRQQLTEMIRQNYNHPSVIMWSMYNELNSATKKLSLPIVKELNALAHSEDTTRPTVAAASADTIVNAHEIVETQDLIADNNYAGWYVMSPADMGPEIEKWNAAYGYRGLAVSEYGGGAKISDHKQHVVNGEIKPYGVFQPEEWQALVHEGNYRAIQQHHVVWGAFPWLAFDSGGIPQEDGSIEGGNIKGLITQDRKTRKDAYFLYQANWSSTPMVYLTSRRDTLRTEATTPIKVYSNAKSVTLTVNGKSYGSQSPNDIQVFHWDDIPLIPGNNQIVVTSADGLRDESVWVYRPDQ